MFILSTYTFISCPGRHIVSWPRQGSQNSLEKPKLMEDQLEFQEEVLDFMGLGFCMPREAWRMPPPNVHGWTPWTSAPTSGASRRASEWRIAGTPAPRHPRGDRGHHPLSTPTRPRRPRQARVPASAPANKARHPSRDRGPAMPHHPTPRPPRHTNSTTLTSAHHRHRTAAP